jgi:probable addiction module antidote protein
MAREITPWDAACTLRSKQDIAAYLDAVLEDGDSELLKAALAEVARDPKLGRAGLYKALTPRGQPPACDCCQGAKRTWAPAFRFEPLT